MNKEKYKKTYDLIMKLGSELTEYNHQWSNELRKEFEDITSRFSKTIK